MTTKEQAKAQYVAAFEEIAGREPKDSEGEWRDFENKWRKTHEFHAEQTAYDPNVPHEKPGIDDERQRRSWASILDETRRDLIVRFEN